MAINMDGLVQGIIDHANPERRENRKAVKVFLSDQLSDKADKILLGQVKFSREVHEAVTAGFITPEQGARMIANREKLSNAMSQFSTDWLTETQ